MHDDAACGLAESSRKSPDSLSYSPIPFQLGVTMLSDMYNLSGKTALVTGGSKGLGKAMARGLAEAGADIVISSRHENELKPALDEILKGTKRRGRYLVA